MGHFEVREEGQTQGQIKVTEEEMDSEKDEIYPRLHNEKHHRERELPVIHTNQASVNPSYEPDAPDEYEDRYEYRRRPRYEEREVPPTRRRSVFERIIGFRRKKKVRENYDRPPNCQCRCHKEKSIAEVAIDMALL